MYSLRMAESVTEGHPDKIADQIADALLDEFLRKDPYSKVSMEIFVTTGLVMVGGELSTESFVDIPKVVRGVVKEIGYTKPELGFDADTCAVVTSIDEQSPEIALGVSGEGAGDTAIVVGYAVKEAPNLMPWSITLAHRITRRVSDLRKTGRFPFLRPDGKVLVSMVYEDGKPRYVKDIVAYVHHDPDISLQNLRELVIEEVLKKEVPEEFLKSETNVKVNPTGRFVIGGPVADTGLTGRKIVSDAYGDIGFSGGSAFSGKDPSKTDRSGSYMARMIAKHVVAAGLADKCVVQIGYAFGLTEPIAFDVETFGTEKLEKEKIEEIVQKVFPLKPCDIIEFLDLRKPIYRDTACYGHFGRERFPWERLDYLDKLKELL
ncbi:methionine adenosyltransferase [Hydrogenivirga sp. 128-5-R1-1]|uniref:methionine adenosyltransferase n=1 Tax=Hydrogenivirga sp. 128-5-R1-1 TaxID=392423 RepID=UPI000515D7AD|nr:methionine adenosyltransferase [Hydrogenivirga sp. 128-5-R1-1]